MKRINWKKIHCFQEKPGWCGPAVIQMILRSVMVEKEQDEIAKDVYKSWWGTSPQLMLAYLSRFFKIVNYKKNGKIADLTRHLRAGHIVVVNWWDDWNTDDPDGHYTIVKEYGNRSRTITMVDPSTQRKGIWKMDVSDFKPRWYDYLDIHGSTWIEGWLLWVDPQSKILTTY